MPDEGPWNDFKAATAVEEGPWTEFAAQPRKRTREEVMASIGPSSESEPGLLTKIGAAGYNALDYANRPIIWAGKQIVESAKALYDLPQTVLKMAGTVPANYPKPSEFHFLSPENALSAVQALTPGGPAQEGSFARGTQKFVSEMASGLSTSPDMLMMAAAGVSRILGGLGQVIRGVPATVFGSGALSDVPAAGQALASAQTGQEQAQEGLRLLLDAILPSSVAKTFRVEPMAPGETMRPLPTESVVKQAELRQAELTGPSAQVAAAGQGVQVRAATAIERARNSIDSIRVALQRAREQPFEAQQMPAEAYTAMLKRVDDALGRADRAAVRAITDEHGDIIGGAEPLYSAIDELTAAASRLPAYPTSPQDLQSRGEVTLAEHTYGSEQPIGPTQRRLPIEPGTQEVLPSPQQPKPFTPSTVTLAPGQQVPLTTKLPDPNASTIRTHQGQLLEEGLQGEGRQAHRGEDLQQPTQAGPEASGAAQPRLEPTPTRPKQDYADIINEELQQTRLTKLFEFRDELVRDVIEANKEKKWEDYNVELAVYNKVEDVPLTGQQAEIVKAVTEVAPELFDIVRRGKLPLKERESDFIVNKLVEAGFDYRDAVYFEGNWKQISRDQKLDIFESHPELVEYIDYMKGIEKRAEPTEPPRLYSVPGMLFDPAFYRQTARQAGELTKNLREYWRGAEDKVLPALRFETRSPLPDLQDKATANQIFSQPFATEKVPVLGRLLGGKARIRTPQDESMAAWHAEFHGVAPAVGSMVHENVRGLINNVFKADAEGNLNVGAMTGQSKKISDVFEGLQRDPSAYRLSAEQRRVFDRVIQPVVSRMKELARKYSIVEDVEHQYFTRIVTRHPRMEERIGTGASRPLSRTSIQRERAFLTEQEGWQKGYEYSTDIEARLAAGVERLYKAMANKRLASDPNLGARTPKQVKAELRESFAEELASGRMTEAQLDRALEGVQARGTVFQPLLMNKIFPPEVAKTLRREFAAEESKVLKGIASANSLLKAVQLGFDFGVGQIQLLPTLYNNPRIWGEAQVRSIQSMAGPRFFAEYARKHKESVSELAQLGISIGRLPEFIEGLGRGEPLSNVPVVGRVAGAFGRQFQTALDVAKVELWESLKDTAPKSEWPKLAQAVEAMTLSGRMEASMVPHGRALLERVLLLAPTYYRGALNNLTASLLERGATRKQSLLALGKFAVGLGATYYAVGKMLGMSDDELKARANPARPDFGLWSVRQADGSVINVGFGGIHRSLLRLLGNVSTESDLKGVGSRLGRYYRAHAGPTVSVVWENITGRDFLGRESSLGSQLAQRLPLSAQLAFPKEGEAPAKPIEYGAQLAGMQAFPESFSARRGREQEGLAQQQFKKPFEKLAPNERLEVGQALEERLKGIPTGMTQKRSREIALEKEDERKAQLLSDLPSDLTTWAKRNKLDIGVYQTTLERKGVSMTLTDKEREKLHVNMVKSYAEFLQQFRNDLAKESWSLTERQTALNKYLTAARRQAWSDTFEEIGK